MRPRRFASNAERQRAYRLRVKRRRKTSVEWYTPLDVFEWFDARWGPFDLDPCASALSPTSARIALWFDVRDDADGLVSPWGPSTGRAFVNPPYSREALPAWVDRAFRAVRDGEVALAALLVPLRPSSAWFRLALERGAELVPLTRRVRFLERLPDGTLQRTQGALFECCALVFRNGSAVTKLPAPGAP